MDKRKGIIIGLLAGLLVVGLVVSLSLLNGGESTSDSEQSVGMVTPDVDPIEPEILIEEPSKLAFNDDLLKYIGMTYQELIDEFGEPERVDPFEGSWSVKFINNELYYLFGRLQEDEIDRAPRGNSQCYELAGDTSLFLINVYDDLSIQKLRELIGNLPDMRYSEKWNQYTTEGSGEYRGGYHVFIGPQEQPEPISLSTRFRLFRGGEEY